MKSLTIALTLLVALLQYKLWLSPGGLREVRYLQNQIAMEQDHNTRLTSGNSGVSADVVDLKKGQDAVEEHARTDLGMIKSGEVFYQIVD